MAALQPKFWLLNRQMDWRTQRSHRVSEGRDGLTLAPAPGGRLAFDSPDGSMGRLVLPRGLALDRTGLLYLLDILSIDKQVPPQHLYRIRRFDPAAGKFGDLEGIGGEGSDSRQFLAPTNIALTEHTLYVADPGARRVTGFDLATLALVEMWGPLDRDGRRVKATHRNAWMPADVFASGGEVYVLDERHSRLYRQAARSKGLELLVEGNQLWSRVIVDRNGRVYLLRSDGSQADSFDWNGSPLGSVSDPAEIRDRFDPPAIVSLQKSAAEPGRFCLPEQLRRLCDRLKPAIHHRGAGCQTPIFNMAGELVKDQDPSESAGPPIYEQAGEWIGKPLDSNVDACQWHRITLDMDELPPGSRLEVWTHASQATEMAPNLPELPLMAPDAYWDGPFIAAGPMQSPDEKPGKGPLDFLVQSREGRFLRLGLRFVGDGFETPRVAAARVYYPRSSYLNLLPAVYQADDESRWFLQRFLSLFQSEWDELERDVHRIERLFDPAAVPEGAFLAYLAEWLGQPLEKTWSEEQKRRLLCAIPGILGMRGTPEGVRKYLQVYVQNITDLSPEEQREYPQIVEGFRERSRVMVSLSTASLGSAAPLWSASAVGRMQLGVFSREGEVRLVSTGDPGHDVFTEFAHRFRVFMPSLWVQSRSDERKIIRAIDHEKPAHTQFDLCLIEPRFRVGIQSTVGLDTIIGGYPEARLSCSPDPDDPDSPPLARPPRGLLGYDTVLGGGERPAPQIGHGGRLGMDGPLL